MMKHIRCPLGKPYLGPDFSKINIEGEVHPNMITSHLVVVGALSQMVKVGGACDEPFWIYKRWNNCAAPSPDSDDVLVVEDEAFYVRGMAR